VAFYLEVRRKSNISLQVPKASPSRPSGNGSVKVKTFGWLATVDSDRGTGGQGDRGAKATAGLCFDQLMLKCALWKDN
jgi:hypothetical protein